LSKHDAVQPSAGRVWLSRFAYDHTIYSIFNYKKRCTITEQGLPATSYDIDYSLGEKMLGAAMSLVAEAWKRENELVRLKADATLVTNIDLEGHQTSTWKRLDTESSQTYLKACGSEIVGLVFAAVSAILGSAPDRNEADNSIQSSRDTQLDQLWRTIEPTLESMMAVRAVDWIKIEAFKIFSALTSPVAPEELPMDSLLHYGFLEGEIANVDIAPKGRELAILELAQLLAEKRVQPEQIPRLPAKWIASKFSSRLGRMFRQALKGLYGLHDGSVVSELLDAVPQLPVSHFLSRLSLLDLC
jgi:hypothetical protein